MDLLVYLAQHQGAVVNTVDANLYFNLQIRIENNYAFEGLRSDPRFVALIDRVQQEIHAERQNVPDPQQLAVAGSL